MIACRSSSTTCIRKGAADLLSADNTRVSAKIGATLVIWAAFQVTWPLRHYLYPGDASWTEQGHFFSWRMMLRGKMAGVRYYLTDPKSGETWNIDLREYLNADSVNYFVGHGAQVFAFARDGYAYTIYPFGIRQEDWANDLPRLAKATGAENSPTAENPGIEYCLINSSDESSPIFAYDD